MYRKKHSTYRVWYYPLFQVSTGVLEHPPWISRNYCINIYALGQARWLTPVIPALQEAEASGSRGQEMETILANMVKPVSTKSSMGVVARTCSPCYSGGGGRRIA